MYVNNGVPVSHQDFTGIVDHSRELSHLPDPNQWIALNSRVEATERDVTELKETTATMNTNINSINDKLTSINNQLQQMREEMRRDITAMDMRINARFNDVDSRFNDRLNGVDSRLTAMDLRINARFNDVDSRLLGLNTNMESKFASVDKTFEKQNIRMGALHKNAMSRLDNRMPGASSDNLEPLFNLDTGEKIQENPTRALLGSMSSVAVENCLRGLEITPVGRRVKGREAESAETGIRYEDIRLSWVRGSD
ncbi:uncharacterized protein CPUR_07977 [Claviceps purpurea 20.1]|uniref:Uncharacterized protein n=1 Tax=Claviceps purpurea (strain 20.1) TaxID=1111077 RepID=M1W5F6_CLAP2|nr:uncharacterized protein CPUR_07977 [Claviceps purpurea 20.1]